MSERKDRRAPALAAIAVSCLWLWSGERAEAQACAEERPPLIVVADMHDAELVRRIGGKVVEVQSLFDANFDPANYDACNARALAVSAFSVYVANSTMCCPCERFWSERLSRLNPGGQMHWIDMRADTAEHSCQRAARQAIDVSRALVAILPQHRETFDANLTTELARLQRLRFEQPQLVSGN